MELEEVTNLAHIRPLYIGTDGEMNKTMGTNDLVKKERMRALWSSSE